MPKKNTQTNQEKSGPNNNVTLGFGGKFLQVFGGDAKERRFFMNLENMDATLHDNMKRSIVKESLSVSHTLACFLSTTGVAWIQFSKWAERSWLAAWEGEGRRGGRNRFSIWRSSKALALRTKTSADLRTAKGLSEANRNPTL